MSIGREDGDSLPSNIFEIKLDKEGIMSAVQFWLNGEVLQVPCEVIDLKELNRTPISAEFNIRFEVQDETD